MIFISCSFDPNTKELVDRIQRKLLEAGIEVYISGQLEAKPLPESIRSKIQASEALLTIITERHSDWVQNEIGIAYGLNKPIYAIIKKGVEVKGILPYITIYEFFDPQQPGLLTEVINRFIQRIQPSRRQAREDKENVSLTPREAPRGAPGIGVEKKPPRGRGWY